MTIHEGYSEDARAKTRHPQAIVVFTTLKRSASTRKPKSTADDAFAMTWTRFLGGGSATLLEVLDSYQQAEQLRLDRPNHEFDARVAAAQTSLLYGRTR